MASGSSRLLLLIVDQPIWGGFSLLRGERHRLCQGASGVQLSGKTSFSALTLSADYAAGRESRGLSGRTA